MKVRPTLAMSTMAASGVGLFAIVWLAAHRLTPEVLGYFLSFLSFGGMVQLADFGLSYASLLAASRTVGTAESGRLPALARFVARWNVVVSFASTTLVGAIGWATFSHASRVAVAPMLDWQGPWLVYLFAAMAAQLGVPGMSVREGAGKVAPVWRLRLAQEVLGTLACLVALLLGVGLWSLSVYVLMRAVGSAFWLLLCEPLPMQGGARAFQLRHWFEESWPFQWRIGLSWLAGYLIFRAFAPIILFERGPVLAGQFGLSISLMNMLIAVTSAWPMSQTARYSSLLLQRRFAEFYAEFPTILWRSTLLSAAAALALSIALWLAKNAGVVLSDRFADPPVTAIILAAAVVHHITSCAAVFLRAGGREPLLIPSVVGALVTPVALWVTARFGSLMDVATVYLLLSSLGVPVALLLLGQIRRSRLVAGSSGNGCENCPAQEREALE